MSAKKGPLALLRRVISENYEQHVKWRESNQGFGSIVFTSDDSSDYQIQLRKIAHDPTHQSAPINDDKQPVIYTPEPKKPQIFRIRSKLGLTCNTNNRHTNHNSMKAPNTCKKVIPSRFITKKVKSFFLHNSIPNTCVSKSRGNNMYKSLSGVISYPKEKSTQINQFINTYLNRTPKHKFGQEGNANLQHDRSKIVIKGSAVPNDCPKMQTEYNKKYKFVSNLHKFPSKFTRSIVTANNDNCIKPPLNPLKVYGSYNKLNEFKMLCRIRRMRDSVDQIREDPILIGRLAQLIDLYNV
jgi:hypothetical protein